MIMLPAFHRERIAAARDDQRPRSSRRSSARAGAPSSTSTAWTRELALRIAMRALFGLDPDAARGRRTRRRARVRGARSASMRPATTRADPARPGLAVRAGCCGRARRLDELIFAEIDRRRASGERGEDILSLLLDATDEDGDAARPRGRSATRS